MVRMTNIKDHLVWWSDNPYARVSRIYEAGGELVYGGVYFIYLLLIFLLPNFHFF